LRLGHPPIELADHPRNNRNRTKIMFCSKVRKQHCLMKVVTTSILEP